MTEASLVERRHETIPLVVGEIIDHEVVWAVVRLHRCEKGFQVSVEPERGRVNVEVLRTGARIGHSTIVRPRAMVGAGLPMSLRRRRSTAGLTEFSQTAHLVLRFDRLTVNMTTPQDRVPTNASGSIDPLVQARLDRLAGRRSATPSPASPRFAPPAPAAQLNRPAAPPARAKRNHAARGSRATALAVSLTAAGALSALFALTDGTSGKIATASATASPTIPTIPPTSAATVSPITAATTPITNVKAAAPTTAAVTAAKTPVSSASTATPGTAAPKVASGLAAGTFDGDVIDTRWGPVQVAVTIANGKVTNVTTLTSPNDKQKSISINNRATPILRSEALSVQSANIDSVSGATYTSEGYASSLQSALDRARGGAASVTA